MFNLDWSFTNSHQFHLFAIAIISTGFTAATIFGTQELRRQIRIQKLKDSAPNGEAETVSMPLSSIIFMSSNCYCS